MDAADREVLLRAARNAIAANLGVEPARVDTRESAPELSVRSGAFVSLHRGPDLRGCIGTFQSDHPLWRTVRDMAVAAASRDPRFSAVGPDDLPSLSVEISVLSTPRPAQAEEVTVGLHGVVVSRDWQRGVLLPQVAVEHGWSRTEFLAHACRKAGLPLDAWRDPATRIDVFEAEVFSEGEPQRA